MSMSPATSTWADSSRRIVDNNREMKKTVYTLNVDGYPKAITDLTYPLIERYASKIRADFHVIRERKFPRWPPVYEKLQIFELGQKHLNDFNIYIDSDALVSPNLFDVTEHIAKDTVVHNGNDMAGNRWKYDRYFRRDGRHIGSCNWFTVASDWCIDLWAPLDDMTLEDAVANIHPTSIESAPWTVNEQTGFEELKVVIAAEHLIDDYVLSRNIARYGLKFTTLIDICKRVGQGGDGGYMWHQYTMTTEDKVAAIKSVMRRWGLACDDDELFLKAFREAYKTGILMRLERARTLWNCAAECSHLSGEYWECGVYRGGSAYIIDQACQSVGHRPVFRLFDTFAGLPEAGEKEWQWRGQFAASQEWAESLVCPGGSDRIKFECGIVPASLPCGHEIAFAHLDMDLYEPTAGALDFIWPRLQPGGSVVVDDYGSADWPGIKKAVDERFKLQNLAITHEQCVIRKEREDTG
jgi:O-methyltransferase